MFHCKFDHCKFMNNNFSNFSPVIKNKIVIGICVFKISLKPR